MSPQAQLVYLLRGLSLINVAAIVAVVAPHSWIAWCHQSLGLGPFPVAPIAGYLARSTSLWFVGFGVLLWFVSNDITHHRGVIAFLGWSMLVQGATMTVIDWRQQLPGWWILAEGPTCLLLGIAVLCLQRRGTPT